LQFESGRRIEGGYKSANICVFLEECPDDDIAKIVIREQHSWNDVVCNNERLDICLPLSRDYSVMNSAILVVSWSPVAINNPFLVSFIDSLLAVASFRHEA
jgi:hypothetical protein